MRSKGDPPSSKRAKRNDGNTASASADEDHGFGPGVAEPLALVPNNQGAPHYDFGSNKVDATILDQAWEHYCNYIDDEGDTDELSELLDILSTTLGTPPATVLHLDDLVNLVRPPRPVNDDHINQDTTAVTLQRHHLVPVLMSVVHCVLADHAISEYLALQQQPAQRLPTSSSSTNNTDFSNQHARNEKDDLTGSTTLLLRQQIHHHLHQSLRLFPDNAAAWSMAANYVRMTNSRTNNNHGTTNRCHRGRAFVSFLASLYLRAAHKANVVRRQSLEILVVPDGDDGVVERDAKEWIERLLLNQVAGVELEEDENDTHSSSSSGVEDEPSSPAAADDHDPWSASSVEGTARFTAAMVLSMAGDHDAAARQLQHFSHITHRLHPNVWEEALPRSPDCHTTDSPPPKEGSEKQPLFFQQSSKQSDHDGILPDFLYQRLCQVFHPDAPYWTESDYNRRGYYSYFMDLPSATDEAPRNLIEDVVCRHLLPLALQQQQQAMNDEPPHPAAAPIVGYEWWVHTRPLAAHLGHNLHFDTDEAWLTQEQQLAHPVVSSVLYLTGGGGGGGGATVVLDQTPESTANASTAWLARPVDNAYLTFPGNLLHGVLPCRGNNHHYLPDDDDDDSSNQRTGWVVATNADQDDESLLDAMSKLWNVSCASEHESAPAHRLTLMVGFWTRRVPDRRKEQKLYGPCGPLPSKEEATWVQAMYQGYPQETTLAVLRDVPSVALPRVTPAWEKLAAADPMTAAPPLSIPRALDHRYFVAHAPSCFRNGLFERGRNDNAIDDDEDCDDDEDTAEHDDEE